MWDLLFILTPLYFSAWILVDLRRIGTDLYKKKTFTLEKNQKFRFLGLISFLLVGFYSHYEESMLKGFEIGLISTLGFGLLVLLISFLYNLTSSKIQIQFLTLMDSQGFKLTTVDLSRDRSKTRSFLWNDIKDIQILGETIHVFISWGRVVKFEPKINGYYRLLQNIPLGYDHFDYTYFKRSFKKLKDCPVCGMVSLHKDECLSCNCESWNTKLKKEYATYDEYIKENQMDIFSTLDKEEVFKDFERNENAFDISKNWKPLVSKEEVLEYSEREFWNL